MKLSHTLAITLTALSLPLGVAAQQNGAPPEPNFAGMSQALGVSQSDLEKCMPKPARGQRPERPNVNTVTTCLKSANGSLTSAKVGSALKKYGPKPPRKS